MARHDLPAHESTIHIVSFVDPDLAHTLIRLLVGNDYAQDDYVPWSIQNKYYSALVHLKLLGKDSDWPTNSEATVLLVDSEASANSFRDIVSSFYPPDVALVVGVSKNTNVSNNLDLEEEWHMLCTEHGFEYVNCTSDLQPLLSSCEDDDNAVRDQPEASTEGINRLRDALQAHPWPTGSMSIAKPSQSESNPSPSRLHQGNNINMFDDDFDSFVSASESNQPQSPHESDIDSLRQRIFSGAAQIDQNDGHFDISDVAYRLEALKSHADGITDREEKRRFAEMVALAFASGMDDE